MPRSRLEKPRHWADYYHLVLLVRNETGYRNLLALASEGFLSGFHFRPRIDREVLVLREFEGLRYREIAELLGIPLGTGAASVTCAGTSRCPSVIAYRPGGPSSLPERFSTVSSPSPPSHARVATTFWNERGGSLAGGEGGSVVVTNAAAHRLDPLADRTPEDDEVERGGDDGRDHALEHGAAPARHLENVDGLDGMEIHERSLTRLTSMSSSDDWLVSRSRTGMPDRLRSVSSEVMPVRAACVSYV